MKLAVVGADDESLELLRWAVTRGDHHLVAAYDGGAFVGQLRQIAPQVRTNQSWEELVVASVADAVIVGRGGRELAEQTGIDHAERRADQLRKLTQAAVPIIVVCPACEAIVGFEIEMIRRDTKAVIVPYIPRASHPAIAMLAELITLGDNSPVGRIEQISFDREQTDRGRPAVLEQLPRDIAILRRLIGNIQSVSASGPAAPLGRDPLGPKLTEPPSLANLSVHFAGDEAHSARWSIGPAIDVDQARVTIVGQRGKAILHMPVNRAWSLQLAGAAATTELFDDVDEPEHVFNQFSLATSGSNKDLTWLAACRDQEAAEAVDRSLARGRTIELFNEEHTEDASFKGVMAMGGCLLLVFTLGVLFLAVVIESLRLPMRGWAAWRLWPLYVLVPLAIFLLLQLLKLAVKREAPGPATVPATGDQPNRLG
jgi:hypothetical protein